MHCWFLTACFFEVIGVAWILKNMFSDCEVWKGELQERIWLSWVCVQSTEQGLKVDVETGEGFEPMLRIGRNMFRQMKRGRGWENQRYPRNNLLIAGWVLLKCGRKLRRQSLTTRRRTGIDYCRRIYSRYRCLFRHQPPWSMHRRSWASILSPEVIIASVTQSSFWCFKVDRPQLCDTILYTTRMVS